MPIRYPVHAEVTPWTDRTALLPGVWWAGFVDVGRDHDCRSRRASSVDWYAVPGGPERQDRLVLGRVDGHESVCQQPGTDLG
jgi:hypothetical protein